MKENKKLFIITRNYPPQIGGLETYSFNLINHLEQRGRIFKLTLGKSKAHLVWFVPYCLFASMYIVLKYRIRKIHLCDGVLSPVGWILEKLLPVHVSVTIHGLDITYPNHLYQRCVPFFLNSFNRVICVSRATQQECIKRGVSEVKCHVINNGITPSDFVLDLPLKKLLDHSKSIAELDVQSKTVLLTVGRLVKRKGIVWFIENVITELNKDYVYLIVGNGSEYDNISQVIKQKSLQARVKLLGERNDFQRNILYHISDFFIMPNIILEGDVEGFGITALEAGVCGLPVIASNIQGIKDAVVPGLTGTLVEPGDAEGFIFALQNSFFLRSEVRDYVSSHFSWETCTDSYMDVLSG